MRGSIAHAGKRLEAMLAKPGRNVSYMELDCEE